MREILFRAKREFDGSVFEGMNEFVYGYFYKISKCAYMFTSNGSQIKINIETLGQYTGLNDKNGKKIFEGDVVKLSSSTAIVSWENGGLGYISKDWGDFISFAGHNHLKSILSYIEVLGNIHDNPELLEEK